MDLVDLAQQVIKLWLIQETPSQIAEENMTTVDLIDHTILGFHCSFNFLWGRQVFFYIIMSKDKLFKQL